MEDLEKALFGLIGLVRRAAGPAAAVALAFATPSVAREGDAIVVQGTLRGAVGPKVARVIRTGAPVTIRFRGRLSAEGWRGAATDASTIRYDALANRFIVRRGASERAFDSLDEAARTLASYRLRFSGTPPRTLDLFVEARLSYSGGLGPSAAPALWDHRTPYLRVREVDRLIAGEGTP